MADDIDLAQEREQTMLDALINHRKPVPTHKGYCLNCDEPVQEAAYCDADCRADHEQRERFNARRSD